MQSTNSPAANFFFIDFSGMRFPPDGPRGVGIARARGEMGFRAPRGQGSPVDQDAFLGPILEGISAPQCHADRHAASAVRDSGTGNVAKAEALVEEAGGIFGPYAEIKAKPAASGLADQRAHELPTNALAARIRFHADRHLRSLFVPVGDPELFGRKAPRPGCTDDFAVLFGDEPEIPGSLPAGEIFGYGRNRLRRLCIGFIGRHREKIPQYLEVILDSRTDHKIGHLICSLFSKVAARILKITELATLLRLRAEHRRAVDRIRICTRLCLPGGRFGWFGFLFRGENVSRVIGPSRWPYRVRSRLAAGGSAIPLASVEAVEPLRRAAIER